MRQVPLIFAAIIYGSNTTNRISFVDCLFLSVSAITATGLATVDLSLLNPFQQACLFVLFVCGSIVSSSQTISPMIDFRFNSHPRGSSTLLPSSLPGYYPPTGKSSSSKTKSPQRDQIACAHLPSDARGESFERRLAGLILGANRAGAAK